MSTHTKHQVIEKDGVPLFVIVPYDEYVGNRGPGGEKTYLPQAVVEKAAVEGKSMVRAWREYKHLSQQDVATRLGITQAAYSQLEKSSGTMRATTLKKIAAALKVGIDQLTI